MHVLDCDSTFSLVTSTTNVSIHLVPFYTLPFVSIDHYSFYLHVLDI